MGHYDDCRDGYCGKCGAAPGNIIGGVCQFCNIPPNPKHANKAVEKILKPLENRKSYTQMIIDELGKDLTDEQLFYPYKSRKAWYESGKVYRWSDCPIVEK